MESQLVNLLIGASAGIMLLAGAVIFFVVLYQQRILKNKLEISHLNDEYQKKLLKATLQSQEEERNRIGVELHDSIGVQLSSIKMALQILAKDSDEDGSQLVSHLNDTIKQVRALSHEMMPAVLKKFGLIKAIEELFKKLPVETAFDCEITKIDIVEGRQLLLFRILQELCNNSLRHGKASKIDLCIKNVNSKITVKYQDNGMGYPVNVLENQKGMGLLNVETRAQALEGSVKFYNSNGRGAVTYLEIPLYVP